MFIVTETEQNQEEDKRADFNDLIHAFNIVITAYGFLINLYPIYDKIYPSQRNHKTIMLAVGMGTLFSALIYLAFSYMSAQVFGMQHLHANLLENMDNDNFFHVVVKLLFLLIFACAIPFNVNVPKRCMLNIIEELMDATISTNLSQNQLVVDVE